MVGETQELDPRPELHYLSGVNTGEHAEKMSGCIYGAPVITSGDGGAVRAYFLFHTLQKFLILLH